MRGAARNRQESFNNVGLAKGESLMAGLWWHGVNSDCLIRISWHLCKAYYVLVGNLHPHRFLSFPLKKMFFNHDAPARVGHKRPHGFLMNVRDAIMSFHALSHE
jgi:hypothetical protein